MSTNLPTMPWGTRCMICHRMLWPWQRVGWRTVSAGTRFYHPACLKAVAEAMREEAAHD